MWQFNYTDEQNKKTGEVKIRKFFDSNGKRVGQEYAENVMATASRQKKVSAIAKTTAVTVGATAVATMLWKRYG